MACRHEIGSVEVGKRADLVLWSPAFFGVKPDMVLLGGIDRRGADGRPQRLDPDAAAGALPPDVRRLRQGAAPTRRSPSSRRPRSTPASPDRLGVGKQMLPVENTRGGIGKALDDAQRRARRISRSIRKPTRCAPTANC